MKAPDWVFLLAYGYEEMYNYFRVTNEKTKDFSNLIQSFFVYGHMFLTLCTTPTTFKASLSMSTVDYTRQRLVKVINLQNLGRLLNDRQLPSMILLFLSDKVLTDC